MVLIYINTHSKSETYCGGYEASLNGLRKFCFVITEKKIRFTFELKSPGIYIDSFNLGISFTNLNRFIKLDISEYFISFVAIDCNMRLQNSQLYY